MSQSPIIGLTGMAMGPAAIEGGGGAYAASTMIQNRAAESLSPFVQEHRESPVAWQLLDQSSLDRARAENKLIFLTIGFKACHQCRLMATESFSNSDCAKILNDSFIPVIVDREERPDLDAIYMNYVAALTSSGGWPLNLFLTPDLAPVFGGLYWPGPSTSRQRSSDNEEEVMDFPTVLKRVAEIWDEKESTCRLEARTVVEQLRQFASEGTSGQAASLNVTLAGPLGSVAASSTDQAPKEVQSSTAAPSVRRDDDCDLDLDQLEEAYQHLAGTFDPVCAGFGLAPKFPTPPKLRFLLALRNFPQEVQDVVGEDECKHARYMALETLRKIRDSALRDHVGGSGFARHSVTADWSMPSFDRLVADNAMLLGVYTQAWITSGGTAESEFYSVVLELVDYLTSHPICLPEGGFASSEAADSLRKRGDYEMTQGAYYLWTKKEFDAIVDEPGTLCSNVAAAYWGVLEDGNVGRDFDPNDEFINQNLLRVSRPVADLGRSCGLSTEQVRDHIRLAKEKLRKRRNQDRPRPALDDKVVASTNGLVVSALAAAGKALVHADKERAKGCRDAAENSINFIHQRLWDGEKKVLYRIWRGGERGTEGFADDYATLIAGCLDLFEVTHNEGILEFADKLQKAQHGLFYDSRGGGFWSTSADAPQAILRLKDGIDNTTLSTNATSADNLFRLGKLLEDDSYDRLARETVNAFEVETLHHPWLFLGILMNVVTKQVWKEQLYTTETTYKTQREAFSMQTVTTSI